MAAPSTKEEMVGFFDEAFEKLLDAHPDQGIPGDVLVDALISWVIRMIYEVYAPADRLMGVMLFTKGLIDTALAAEVVLRAPSASPPTPALAPPRATSPLTLSPQPSAPATPHPLANKTPLLLVRDCSGLAGSHLRPSFV